MYLLQPVRASIYRYTPQRILQNGLPCCLWWLTQPGGREIFRDFEPDLRKSPGREGFPTHLPSRRRVFYTGVAYRAEITFRRWGFCSCCYRWKFLRGVQTSTELIFTEHKKILPGELSGHLMTNRMLAYSRHYPAALLTGWTATANTLTTLTPWFERKPR